MSERRSSSSAKPMFLTPKMLGYVLIVYAVNAHISWYALRPCGNTARPSSQTFPKPKAISLDPGDACSDTCLPHRCGRSVSFLAPSPHGLRVCDCSVPLRAVDHVSVAGALGLPP